MVSKIKWLGILVLVFGMTVVGCNGGSKNVDRRLNGTWVSEDWTMKLNSGNLELSKKDGFPVLQGTYITSGGIITQTYTHYFNQNPGLDSRWYSKNEFETALGREIDLFNPTTQKYFVNGNTFTLIYGDDETDPWTLVSRDGKFTLVAASDNKPAATGRSSERTSAIPGRSSGRTSAIPGRWYLVEGPSGYPKDVDLLKDGSGIAQGAGFTWKVENGRFYIIHPFFGLSAIYNVSGTTLTLTKDDGEILKYQKK
ncbi:MAG: hypothetical protein LBH43_14555 [Treponema sp.]|nr:hypothetical protein [Treponema sp.]